jgi:hypothetical protein
MLPFLSSSWFPDKVFDIASNNWTAPDESDWDVTAPTAIRCPANESAEVIYDTNMFVILSNGKLYLPQHSKDVAPGRFCVDLLIGEQLDLPLLYAERVQMYRRNS